MNKKPYNNKSKKGYPCKPCEICIVRASCNVGMQMFKCQDIMDYYNAKYYKDRTRICTFNINRFGVWQVFVTGRSTKRKIEGIVKLSEGKSMQGGPLFDYKKHKEYTKHLEALEYYDAL